ncbi:hypothetical protein, partial [Lentimicrobium sp. S6]|uniref:hypothetical protein n=1 Tax=Lentimicrobium sp. S6 TaxID=2735872 RepID=UPI001C130990
SLKNLKTKGKKPKRCRKLNYYYHHHISDIDGVKVVVFISKRGVNGSSQNSGGIDFVFINNYHSLDCLFCICVDVLKDKSNVSSYFFVEKSKQKSIPNNCLPSSSRILI